MGVTAILPIPGVSDELLQAINERFRQLEAARVAPASSSTKTVNTVTVLQGSVGGLFFLAVNRPDANGTPAGTFGYETDTGTFLQVQTVSSAQVWVQVSPWLDDGTTASTDEQVKIDEGASPPNSQLVLRANALGGFSMICSGADSSTLGFDIDFAAAAWVARDTSIAAITKTGDLLYFYGSTGNSVGSAPTFTLRAVLNLATGYWRFGDGTTASYPVESSGDINAVGVFRKGGTAGESTTLTYVTGLSGVIPVGLTVTTKTVTFSGGIETAHT